MISGKNLLLERLAGGMMVKVIINKIRCKKCGDVIESTSVHDFKFCKCGAVAVDGGHEYLRRIGEPGAWEELSVTEAENDSLGI